MLHVIDHVYIVIILTHRKDPNAIITNTLTYIKTRNLQNNNDIRITVCLKFTFIGLNMWRFTNVGIPYLI